MTIVKNNFILDIGVLDSPIFDTGIQDLIYLGINILLQNYRVRSYWIMFKHIITNKIKFIFIKIFLLPLEAHN